MHHQTSLTAETVKPYIIPIIDISDANLTIILRKIAQFNEIIRLVAERPPIYNRNNFIRNIQHPHLHHCLRKDLMQTLQIIYTQPQKTWAHSDQTVVACIKSLQVFFEPFQYKSGGFLFASCADGFDWASLSTDKTTVSFYFFECMRILFGIDCFLPNTGSLPRTEAPLTLYLTNFGGHFSIGSQYLLTRSDGNCFFHLYCQIFAALCLQKSLRNQSISHLNELTHMYAIRHEDDKPICQLNNIRSKEDLNQLLNTLFTGHIRDIETLKQDGMLALSAHLITDFFKISIREHWVDDSGETYLKETHGNKHNPWSIDTLKSNEKLFISDHRLGDWKEIKTYTDYVSTLSMFWLPSVTNEHTPTPPKTP